MSMASSEGSYRSHPEAADLVTLKRPLRKHGWKNFPMSGLFKIFPGSTARITTLVSPWKAVW
jgi:hypothetical protein